MAGIDSVPPPSALPAHTPPTAAADDEPSPRDSGIRLWAAIRHPTVIGRGPRCASIAASSPITNRLDRSPPSSPAPSPVVTSSIDPSPSTASTVTRLHSSSARPRQS